MPHILLTGAGFSHNWGGWLSAEVHDYLLGCPQVNRELLERYKSDGGFEAAYDEVQTEAEKPGRSVALLNEATEFDAAIRQMFGDMNGAFSKMGKLNFDENTEESVTAFLDRFDAIFTLNQDLLLERLYKADNLSMLLHPRDWYMPGMEPIDEPTGTAVKDVKEWRPMDKSRFAVDESRQPYFKLHGSSNWLDHSSGHSMLVIGRNKEFLLGHHQILMWNFLQFREYLRKPDTRLMIIGYGFRDQHINNAIGAAADGGTLRVFIISPWGLRALEQEDLWMRPDYLGEGLKPYLIGASTRPFSRTFGGDLVEHGKVMRFF